MTILGLMLEADGKRALPIRLMSLTSPANFLAIISGLYSKTTKRSYQKGDFKTMKAKEQLMLGILSDMDRVLSTQSAFLMGKWISDARKLGANEKKSLYFEQNARNLLTTWGRKGFAPE